MRADVSVVVTVKNDPRVVRCLERILTQETPFAFDVVVVDNASTDETPRVLHERFGSNPHVRIVASGGNLSASWNYGAQSSDAPVLARIDADMVPLDGWLAALAAPLVAGRADWTAGPVSGMAQKPSLVARYIDRRTEAYGRRLAEDPELRDAVASWNVAYTRAALDRAGWYDPWQASSVDWDLHKRLVRSRLRGTFVAEARCLHDHPGTLREFLRKEALYRTGHYQMALKYGLREMLPAFVIPGAYALVLILAVIGLWFPIFWWLDLLLLVGLLTKHWIGGLRDRDPMWPYRALFRPLEGFAGLYGLLRGVVTYGIRRHH